MGRINALLLSLSGKPVFRYLMQTEAYLKWRLVTRVLGSRPNSLKAGSAQRLGECATTRSSRFRSNPSRPARPSKPNQPQSVWRSSVLVRAVVMVVGAVAAGLSAGVAGAWAKAGIAGASTVRLNAMTAALARLLGLTGFIGLPPKRVGGSSLICKPPDRGFKGLRSTAEPITGKRASSTPPNSSRLR